MRSPSVRSRRGRYGLAVAYATIVLVASVAPVADGGLPATGPLGLVAVDRWIHAGTYALLALLLAIATRARSSRTLVVVALVAVSYGAGIELLQAALPYRALDPVDATANTVGAVLATASRWAVAVRQGRLGRLDDEP